MWSILLIIGIILIVHFVRANKKDSDRRKTYPTSQVKSFDDTSEDLLRCSAKDMLNGVEQIHRVGRCRVSPVTVARAGLSFTLYGIDTRALHDIIYRVHIAEGEEAPMLLDRSMFQKIRASDYSNDEDYFKAARAINDEIHKKCYSAINQMLFDSEECYFLGGYPQIDQYNLDVTGYPFGDVIASTSNSLGNIDSQSEYMHRLKTVTDALKGEFPNLKVNWTSNGCEMTF